MSINIDLFGKNKLVILSFNHTLICIIFICTQILLSCSSINLDQQPGDDNYGVAPIQDVKKEKTSNIDPSDKPLIIESPIAPIDFDRKQRIDNKMLLYKSYEPSIYFDYDDFKIKKKYQELIKITYELMQLNTQYTLRVEGHSDERGTTEYNLALGQKRAEAVVRAIEQLGVPRNRIDAISFGEEKPIAVGSTSKAWEKNRRADLTLK